MLNSKAAVSFIPDKNEKTKKKSRSKKALFRSFVVESGRIAAAAATASSFFFFLPASVRPLLLLSHNEFFALHKLPFLEVGNSFSPLLSPFFSARVYVGSEE